MKIMKLITAFILCTCQGVVAQFKHYASYNFIFYKNYFNVEKDKSYPLANLVVPNLSYKIEYKKFGTEVFCSDGVGVEYYSFTDIKNNKNKDRGRHILNATSFALGIAVHYNVYDSRKIKINAMLGVAKNWYRETILLNSGYHSNGWFEIITGSNRESLLGLLAGVNINVPIWKGIYANTNTRYMVFPGAQYNKQNLVFDIGLGYMYQRKVKNQQQENR